MERAPARERPSVSTRLMCLRSISRSPGERVQDGTELSKFEKAKFQCVKRQNSLIDSGLGLKR
jgi:hypothetical protein